jgi:hypothetical protein
MFHVRVESTRKFVPVVVDVVGDKEIRACNRLSMHTGVSLNW